MTVPALQTRDLTIRFGGHVAVASVTYDFRPGCLVAIVGPNGAGKTTYFNLISGQLRASAGTVIHQGEDITRLPVPERTRRGIGRAFQLTNLFPRLSVLENVRLAIQARHPGAMDLFRLADGLGPDLRRGPLSAFFAYIASEYAAAFRLHRARKKHV